MRNLRHPRSGWGIADLLESGAQRFPATFRRGFMAAPGDDTGLVGGLKLVLTDRAAAATIVMLAREFARRV